MEVTGSFLVIWKTFGKVWNEGLLLKLNQNGISGKFLKLLHEFLYWWEQLVVPNGQDLSWDNVNAVVSQRFVLGPSLFLIYINDLSNGLSTNCKFFADDTYFFQW